MVNNCWRDCLAVRLPPSWVNTRGLSETDCTPKPFHYLQKNYHRRVSPACLLSADFGECYTRKRKPCEQLSNGTSPYCQSLWPLSRSGAGLDSPLPPHALSHSSCFY